VDENGYMLTAKRLAVNGDIAKRTSDPYEFVSENWPQTANGVFYAKYPIGYPLLCAVAYRLGGPTAVFLVNPVLATLAVLGMFLLGRALLGDFAGILAAVLLAVNPLHLYFGLSALSHTGSVCCAVWAMYFVWRWTQAGGWWNALLGGACAAYGVSVRYTEALLALPIIAMVAWRFAGAWRNSPSYRERAQALGLIGAEVVTMAVGAAAALMPLLAQHAVAYGSIFGTGYGLCGEATGFGWQWFTKNWELMLSRLDGSGLYLIFPVGVAGLAWLAGRDGQRALFLGLWAVPPVLLYTAYYWAPQGEGMGYIRFFVSVFPALILGALNLVFLAGPLRPVGTVLVGGFVALVVVVNARAADEQLARHRDRLAFTQTVSSTVLARLPADAVILSNSRVLNFVEFAGDYRLYTQEMFEKTSVARRTKVLNDNEPHPFHREKAAQMKAAVGGRTDLQLAELQRDVIGRHLRDGRTVTVIAPDSVLPTARGRLASRFTFTTLATWREMQGFGRGPVRTNQWTLCRLEPRQLAGNLERPLTLEERIDQTQFELRVAQAEFAENFPEAKAELDKVNQLERQLRAHQDQLQRRQALRPAATNAPGATPRRSNL
jgi:hypothetical protein